MTKILSLLASAFAAPHCTEGFTFTAAPNFPLHLQTSSRPHVLLSPLKSSSSSSTSSSSSDKKPFVLLFDCDGVIIETEELHRLAYNAAFKEFDLKINDELVEWTVPYYDVLQNTVGGGKNKMFFHFRNTTGAFPTYVDVVDSHSDSDSDSDISGSKSVNPAPTTPEQQQNLIDKLQSLKTTIYKSLIATRATPRPGILPLMDAALSDPNILVGVCSASTKAAVDKVLDVTLGKERRSRLDVCILGEDVERLKPDPMIYVTAAERLGVGVGEERMEERRRCVVIEDSVVGLKAAKGAGMRCIITYTSSTEKEDFYGLGCDAKVPDLESRGVTLDMIFGPLRTEGLDAEILKDVRDEL